MKKQTKEQRLHPCNLPTKRNCFYCEKEILGLPVCDKCREKYTFGYQQAQKDDLKETGKAINQAIINRYRLDLNDEIEFLQVLGKRGSLIVENYPEIYNVLDKIRARIEELKKIKKRLIQ